MFGSTASPSATAADTVGDVGQVVRVCRVVSVDRGAATCIVAFGDPDGDGEVLSAAIPWLCASAGETIVWNPPSEGEQGHLLCPDGDLSQGVFARGIYSNEFPAPGNGDRIFVRFGDGAELGYDPQASTADITLPDGGTLAITAPGGVTIDGDVTVTGDVIADGISLKSHTHADVQPGNGQSGAPA